MATEDERRGDAFVRRLLAGDDDEDLAYLLLNELFAGYSIDGIPRLIQSGVPEAVKAGAWLMSELGTRAAPLVAGFPYLLDDDDRSPVSSAWTR